MIKSIPNFISKQHAKDILDHILSYADQDWSKMNEEHINGPFWNNKRIFIAPEITDSLSKSVVSEVGEEFLYTAINKAQRFFSGDVLGPLIDVLHGPQIRYGIALFLENKDGGIRFPQKDKSIQSIPGTLVIYSSDEEYEIFVAKGEPIMHFMTFFADEV